MWTISTPASASKSAVARCGSDPLPEVAKLSLPGFFFASAMSSRIDFTGSEGWTATTSGELVTCVTATKSRSVSYEIFLLTIGLGRSRARDEQDNQRDKHFHVRAPSQASHRFLRR